MTHPDQPAGTRRTVLLDLDGTLVDSALLITEHLAAALATTGAPALTRDQLRSCVGPPFEQALPAFGLTDEQTAAAVTVYRHTYDRVAATHTPPFPGVRALLARLQEVGLRLAVATSKPEHLARRIVAALGLGPHFALVGGADHVAGRVGKAAVVGSVLDRLALDPRREPVVMVGDRHHDIDGAAEFGIPTIGVAWGYATDPTELHGARIVVSDPDELAAALIDGAVSSTPVRDRAAVELDAAH